MRTTINLPDGLVEEVRRRATTEGRTFTSLVAEGLRTVLERRDQPEHDEPLPSYGTSGGRVLVDLSDREAVWEVFDPGVRT